MHHCVGTYGGHVRRGDSYFYSVRTRGNRVATAQLHGLRDRVSLGPLKGAFNSSVPKDLEGAVRKWFGSNFPKVDENSGLDLDVDLDGDIPF